MQIFVNLKEARNNAKMSVNDLTIKSAVKISTIQAVENGTSPRLDDLLKLAAAVGVGLKQLLFIADENGKQIKGIGDEVWFGATGASSTPPATTSPTDTTTEEKLPVMAPPVAPTEPKETVNA